MRFLNSIANPFSLTESALADQSQWRVLIGKVRATERGMAEVAKPSSVPPSSHRIGSGPLKSGSLVRKKTPSELRVSSQAHDLNLAFDMCGYNGKFFGYPSS